VPIGTACRPMLAATLEAVRETLACVLVELPIREAGGQLPSWDELEALKARRSERGVPLHMDGARLWESAALLRHGLRAIAAGFDSVYVSVYKGIGGFAGALLAATTASSPRRGSGAGAWAARSIHLSPLVAARRCASTRGIALMPALYERAVDARRRPRRPAGPARPTRRCRTRT
jgi:hypothetical protein